MGFLDEVSSKFKESTGNVAKAYLCVRNPEGVDPEKATLKAMREDSDAVQKGILEAAAKKIDSKAALVDGAIAENIVNRGKRGDSSSSNSLSLKELSAAMEKNNFIAIEVQYNPNSIKMRSDPGGRRRITAIDGVGSAGEGQSIKKLPKSTELSCTLIFERINVNDAFIQASEGWNASTGNLLSTGGSMAKKFKAKGDEEVYSVRKEVEGFLGMLCSDYTRDVIFYYGKMVFHGELVNAAATYKMFNKNGDPIYAEVTIRIRQSDEITEYEKKRWRYAYDALFKDSDEKEEKSGGQKFSAGVGSVFDTLGGGIF